MGLVHTMPIYILKICKCSSRKCSVSRVAEGPDSMGVLSDFKTVKRKLHALCQLCQPVLNILILYYIYSLCQVCLFVSSQEMKKEMPFLSHCVVIGDDRKYLTMLVTLKCEVRIAGKKEKRRERREGRGNVVMCGKWEKFWWKSLIPLCFNVPPHPIIRTCIQTHTWTHTQTHTIHYAM